jgi:hypothetical protein
MLLRRRVAEAGSALSYTRAYGSGGRSFQSTAAPVSHNACETEDFISLDEVDLGRKVAGDFETNFLLAHFGFRPDLHGVSSKR